MGNVPSTQCCCSSGINGELPAGAHQAKDTPFPQQIKYTPAEFNEKDGEAMLPDAMPVPVLRPRRSYSMESTGGTGDPCGDPDGAEEDEEVPDEREVEATLRSIHLRTQLLDAASCDNAPRVLQCIADGADITDMGEALRLAAHWGGVSVVRELVAVGISVNDRSPCTSLTPLQLAAANGHLPVCELLLDALADVNQSVKSLSGSTPLALSRKMGHDEVEEALKRHAASLVSDGQEATEGAELALAQRSRVLPRASPELSEAAQQVIPGPPVQCVRLVRNAIKTVSAEADPAKAEAGDQGAS
eukprot:gnl/TRDRNA2_/TRDRNA2_164569_c0_seq1.p1 gnl/TRDRNA2_/TRDRNA2_164569_c0~~gnl/TRDRNA2_/TRDRNA2_164569_c0_seq1.p1  ORF type:complete len:302 (-),score=65.28 gnl/TRDRNA2_/TRDRNA2_164569_c0_seq1:88-993(-)